MTYCVKLAFVDGGLTRLKITQAPRHVCWESAGVVVTSFCQTTPSDDESALP